MAAMKEQQIEIMDYVESELLQNVDEHLKEIEIANLAAIKKLCEVAYLDFDEASSLVLEWQKPIVQEHANILSQCLKNSRGA